jgi:hypothetical protein
VPKLNDLSWVFQSGHNDRPIIECDIVAPERSKNSQALPLGFAKEGPTDGDAKAVGNPREEKINAFSCEGCSGSGAIWRLLAEV